MTAMSFGQGYMKELNQEVRSLVHLYSDKYYFVPVFSSWASQFEIR